MGCDAGEVDGVAGGDVVGGAGVEGSVKGFSR